MSNIEAIIGLLLLFMVVPDVCRKFGRPSLVYPVFVVLGLALQPIATPEVITMIHAGARVGFLLLLFEVGLEIDLPPWREFARPLRTALPWAALQYPAIFAVAHHAGLGAAESLIASAALTGCSVGMVFAAWKHYPNLSPLDRHSFLRLLIVLETLAIVLLAAETAALKQGLSWTVGLRVAGVLAVVALVGSFASHLTRLFQTVLERATHWRTHLLVLLILAICALGERIGLSAPKTAFFLGLFMSRAQHDGRSIEEFIAPISQRLLIPIFFVALGIGIPASSLLSWNALLAFGTSGLLLAIRRSLHLRGLTTGGDSSAFLLLCPNLTVVALAASALLEARPADPHAATWLLLTGLFLTVGSILLLPRVPETPPANPPPTGAPVPAADIGPAPLQAPQSPR